MEIKVSQLKAVAEDMNRIMGLNPPIKVHFAKTEALTAEIIANAIGDDGKGNIIEKDGLQEVDNLTVESFETIQAILTAGSPGHDRALAICAAKIAAAPPKEERTAPAGKAGKATKEKKEKTEKVKKEKVAKGPGVLSVIQEMIVAATKAKPVTKEMIVTELVSRFPDRNADSMKNTVNIQIPSRMAKEKSLNIVKAEGGGFYVEK